MKYSIAFKMKRKNPIELIFQRNYKPQRFNINIQGFMNIKINGRKLFPRFHKGYPARFIVSVFRRLEAIDTEKWKRPGFSLFGNKDSFLYLDRFDEDFLSIGFNKKKNKIKFDELFIEVFEKGIKLSEHYGGMSLLDTFLRRNKQKYIDTKSKKGEFYSEKLDDYSFNVEEIPKRDTPPPPLKMDVQSIEKRNRIKIGINNLDLLDKIHIGECLNAVINGPFIPKWEFSILFGLYHDEVKIIADTWPNINFENDNIYSAITGSLNHLKGYPIGGKEQWNDFISIPRDELTILLKRWKQLVNQDNSGNSYFENLV